MKEDSTKGGERADKTDLESKSELADLTKKQKPTTKHQKRRRMKND